jgi:hypothetical protein
MPCEKQDRGGNLTVRNKIHSRTYRVTATHEEKIRRGLFPITKVSGTGRIGPPRTIAAAYLPLHYQWTDHLNQRIPGRQDAKIGEYEGNIIG